MKTKVCSICGLESQRLWRSNPPVCAKNSCKQADLRNREKGKIKQVSDKRRQNKGHIIAKAAGELSLFKAIWEIRPHVCQVTGEPLNEFDIWGFMHILSKKAYPKFKLYEKNILLVKRSIHVEYDCGDRSLSMFDKVRKLHDELIREYYAG